MVKYKYWVTFFVLLFSIWWYYPIRSVVVVGKFNSLDKADIYNSLNKELSVGIYRLSLVDVKNKMNMISGVESAKVWRCWPGDLVISLKAREPMVRYMSGGYVDKFGVLFYPSHNFHSLDLPVLNVSKDLLLEAAKLFVGLQTIVAQKFKITSLRSHLGIGWEVEMQGNIKIMLPEEKSLIIFKKFINNIYKIKRKHDIYVDLRYLNGFAVKNI